MKGSEEEGKEEEDRAPAGFKGGAEAAGGSRALTASATLLPRPSDVAPAIRTTRMSCEEADIRVHRRCGRLTARRLPQSFGSGRRRASRPYHLVAVVTCKIDSWCIEHEDAGSSEVRALLVACKIENWCLEVAESVEALLARRCRHPRDRKLLPLYGGLRRRRD